MIELLKNINGFIWGIPALIMIVSVGIYFSIRTGFLQIRGFPHAIHGFYKIIRNKRENKDGVSSYQAVCTALAATVGTGNLAGVAGAIAIGGPGSIFWMWVCGMLGMITKFAEAVLAVRFRVKNKKGDWVGGPMYMISEGLGKKWQWLAMVYCFFGVIAAFGVGNATQINTVICSVNSVLKNWGIPQSNVINGLIGMVIAIVIAIVFTGGAKRIGAAAEKLVPIASVFYIAICTGVLILKADHLPKAFELILKGAFDPNAVTGGMLGSAFIALRTGASRGVFTNEAGMGTASIAHAAASVSHPVEQGFMGIMEVFLDTIVICTMTALAILCSGIQIDYGVDTGILLTVEAFTSVYGNWICVPIALAICCFAFATVLGWGLYGGRCAQYLFGEEVWRPFVFLQAVFVILGAIMNTGVVWILSEIVNGLMAIPNLIVLLLLSPELIKLITEYKSIWHT